MKDLSSIEVLQKKLDEMSARLQKAEAERNSVIDNIPFIAWLKDKDGHFLHVNQLYIDTFKLSYNKIIGKTEFDIFPRELAQKHNQEDEKVIKQKQSINFQTKQENEWFSTIKSPVLGNDGEIIGTTGFERNITDNIETLNSLRKERGLLHSLMENIPDSIYFKDIKSRFIRINRAKASEIGLGNPHDAIGKSDFDFMDKDKANVKLKDEELILNTGAPLISKEEKILTTLGKERWISTTKSPIKDEKSNIVGLVGISRDITNQKEIMQKLNEERDFLQVLMDYIPYTIYFKDSSVQVYKNQSGTSKAYWY